MSEQKQAQRQERRLPDNIIAGTFRKADAISAALRAAQERFHLVSAGTSTAVPEGVAVAFSPILIDVDAETYKIPGAFGDDAKFGLAKTALDRIAAAAGLSWDVHETKRVDDGSHPYFVHYQAVGSVRDFDGSKRVYKAEKILDMRDGSAELETFVQVCAGKIVREGKYAKPPVQLSAKDPKVLAQARDKAENQIRAVRAHIIGHAESKAKNRVIRALGVRTSYTADELKKPFIVARPVYTGESADPETRRENQAAIRQAFLGGSSALGLGTPALPAPAQAPARSMAPIDVTPITESDEWPIDDDDDEPESKREPEKRADETKRERRDTPQPSKPADAPAGDGPAPRETFGFGNAKGDPIVEAEDEQIAWYVEALTKSVNDPEKARFKAQNAADLAFCKSVLKRRSGEDSNY